MMLAKSMLSRLSDLLAERIGLHFPAERFADLERGIGAAAHAFGFKDATSCAQWLLSSPLSHREIEVLASCLTIGETYFFRDKRSFEVLEQQVVPELVQARWQNERRLRIWSAGCCTGEEPYSIAMLMDRLIPDRRDWNVTLLATDINPEFLAKAERAEYSEWSFRDSPSWIRSRYFRNTRPGSYKLVESIRRQVTFSSLNLAEDSYPSLSNNTNAMDLIFCRNVLMYFTAERVRAVIEKLQRALTDGGWLVVSPAETSSALFSGLQAVAFDGAIFYRKKTDAQSCLPMTLPQEPIGAPMFEQAAMATPMPMPIEIPDTPMPMLAVEPAPQPSPDLEGQRLAVLAHDCANNGRLNEAREWCCQAIGLDKLNPAYHYLLATIEQEQGQLDAAGQSLVRALYLDDRFVLAHFALGNLRRAQGRHREASRHYANALAVLRSYAPDEALPEADGLTAGRLGEIISSLQTVLSPVAYMP